MQITPAPTPTEHAAIVAALHTLLVVGEEGESGEAPPLPAWAAAGRREALRGLHAGIRSGWTRDVDRTTPW